MVLYNNIISLMLLDMRVEVQLAHTVVVVVNLKKIHIANYLQFELLHFYHLVTKLVFADLQLAQEDLKLKHLKFQ